MTFEFDEGVFEEAVRRMEAAIEESCAVVAAANPGGLFSDVRDALAVELAKRFDPGTGPDAVAIDQLAEHIVSSAA